MYFWTFLTFFFLFFSSLLCSLGTGRAVATAGSAAKKFEDKTGAGKAAASGVIKGVGWAINAASSAGGGRKTQSQQEY